MLSPQLRVIVVQPDETLGSLLERALGDSGHEVIRVAAASWAVSLVRSDPPDAVLLERKAAGFERLLDAIDGLPVPVPVLVTRFSEEPETARWLGGTQTLELVRRVEAAVWMRP